MDALLSLQEIPDDELNKRNALEQSNEVVGALENLRSSLLGGNITEAAFDKLKNIAKLKKHFINDIKLTGIMNDIELRVAVEVAKLERAKVS